MLEVTSHNRKIIQLEWLIFAWYSGNNFSILDLSHKYCICGDFTLCVHACICVYVSCVGKDRLPKVMLFSEMKKRPALFSHGHTLVLCRGVIAFSLSSSLKRGLGEFAVLTHMRPRDSVGIIERT